MTTKQTFILFCCLVTKVENLIKKNFSMSYRTGSHTESPGQKLHYIKQREMIERVYIIFLCKIYA